MKQSGWTSIDQSKKLIEAGLDPNTADMLYHPLGRHGEFDIFPTIGDTLSIDDMSCWSIGALIELLPKTIETKKPKNLYFLEILPASNCVAYIALNENKEYVFLKSIADSTLLDNVVEMICWLLNNNYIKKEKQNE